MGFWGQKSPEKRCKRLVRRVSTMVLETFVDSPRHAFVQTLHSVGGDARPPRCPYCLFKLSFSPQMLFLSHGVLQLVPDVFYDAQIRGVWRPIKHRIPSHVEPLLHLSVMPPIWSAISQVAEETRTHRFGFMGRGIVLLKFEILVRVLRLDDWYETVT